MSSVVSNRPNYQQWLLRLGLTLTSLTIAAATSAFVLYWCCAERRRQRFHSCCISEWVGLNKHSVTWKPVFQQTSPVWHFLAAFRQQKGNKDEWNTWPRIAALFNRLSANPVRKLMFTVSLIVQPCTIWLIKPSSEEETWFPLLLSLTESHRVIDRHSNAR